MNHSRIICSFWESWEVWLNELFHPTRKILCALNYLRFCCSIVCQLIILEWFTSLYREHMYLYFIILTRKRNSVFRSRMINNLKMNNQLFMKKFVIYRVNYSNRLFSLIRVKIIKLFAIKKSVAINSPLFFISWNVRNYSRPRRIIRLRLWLGLQHNRGFDTYFFFNLLFNCCTLQLVAYPMIS